MGAKRKQRNLNIPMKEEEYEAFLQLYRGTICRNMSSYARKMLLGQPVTIITRNRSLDDFIELGVRIRKDLKLLLAKDGFSPAEKEELIRHLRRIEEILIKIVQQCNQQ